MYVYNKKQAKRIKYDLKLRRFWSRQHQHHLDRQQLHTYFLYEFFYIFFILPSSLIFFYIFAITLLPIKAQSWPLNQFALMSYQLALWFTMAAQLLKTNIVGQTDSFSLIILRIILENMIKLLTLSQFKFSELVFIFIYGL